MKEGRIEEALAYAEASRGLNQSNLSIDAACERILIDCGRVDEAYARYALTANEGATGVATFRAIAKKYPGRDPGAILTALAESSGDPGRYFAAAKDAGYFELALQFAEDGRTDPRTLSRAARDLAGKEAEFAMRIGRLALARFLDGYGYDVIPADVFDAYRYFVAAAERLGKADIAVGEAIALAEARDARQPSLLAGALLGRLRR